VLRFVKGAMNNLSLRSSSCKSSYVLHYVIALSNSIYTWSALAVLCAAIHCWFDRHSMNPDGMAYLDMASESLKSGPSNLVNGYWSPLYPAVISLIFAILRPSAALEFPLLHFTNFLIFCLTLVCFTFFIKSWTAAHETQEDRTSTGQMKSPPIIPFSFSIFLWFMIRFTSPSDEHPDLCVVAVVLLAAAICCRISLPNATLRHFLSLGVVLGIGYYAKAAMFPISLILIVLLLVLPPTGRAARLKVVMTGLVFLIVVAPLVALVSRRVGHLSVGETGPINYAVYVNGLPGPPSWTASSGNGTPEHPLRTLSDKPIVLYFAAPVKGTNPLQYDPSYWFAGAKVHFNLRQQWTTVRTNLGFYFGFVSQMIILFSGALMLSFLNQRLPHRPGNMFWWLILWPLATCVMYVFVHVEARFITGFLVLFWLGIYGALWQSVSHEPGTAILGTVFFVLLVPTVAHITKASMQTGNDIPDYVRVGDALRRAGIHAGDSLAAAGGRDFESGGRVYRESSAFTAYYARYVGARVVAAIVDADDGKDLRQRPTPSYWYLSTVDLARAIGVLAAINVKAIIALDRPAASTPAPWQPVVGTPYSILLVKSSDSLQTHAIRGRGP
jgi:hypothetical protein